MNNEAPKRIWIDALTITTPSMRVLHGEPPPDGAKSVEYVRADLARVDPPAAPPPCAMCDTGLVFTDQELAALDELYKRTGLRTAQTIRQALRVYQLITHRGIEINDPALGSKAAPAPADERDKALAQRVIELEARVPFDSPSIRAEFIEAVDLPRLVDWIAAALATVRAEVLENACRAICPNCVSEFSTPAEPLEDKWWHRHTGQGSHGHLFKGRIAGECAAWPIRNLMNESARKAEG